MTTRIVEVLFVGERPPLHSPVLNRLKDLGCECSHVALRREALTLLGRPRFAIVLSKASLPDGNARGLAHAVGSVSGSLFLSVPVENSCWWIPVVRDGKPCRGAAALRPGQFAEELLRAVETALSRTPARSVIDRRRKPPRRSDLQRSLADEPLVLLDRAY